MRERYALAMILIALIVSLAIPLGLDRFMPVPEDNPVSAARVELGRRLFFDPRLSRDGSLSCATCHDPFTAFADHRPTAVGIGGRAGRRNSPALVNRGYGRIFFWDGRETSLEDQVTKPIEDTNELGSSLAEASRRVGVAPNDIAKALSSFVRSILSGDSRYDRYASGDRSALTPDEQAGLQLFHGKANCAACHIGPNFTDERVHNTGVSWRNGTLVDVGAGRGAFKTPTLREVTQTAPYMHDGSLASLEDVVEFYDGGGRANPDLDSRIRPLGLSADEKRQLVLFLGTLSGELQYGADTQRVVIAR